jgi:ketosteroid isomerase-like protein
MIESANLLQPRPVNVHSIVEACIMRMGTVLIALATASLFPVAIAAQTGAVTASARAGIYAGNQAWIDGVKAGDVTPIIATYTVHAVDCGPTGECIEGRPQIEQHMKAQLAKRGRARTATVGSWGSSQQGNFVYEWGQAEATFGGGTTVVDKYLTVWQKQPDGSWKIFRNMAIPDR